MSDILPKSDEQIVAEGDVDSFRQDLGPFVVTIDIPAPGGLP